MKPKEWAISLLGALLAVSVVCFWRTQRDNDVLQTRLAAVAQGTSRLVGENTELREEVRRAHDETLAVQAELTAARDALAQKPERISTITPETVQRWLGEASDPAVMRRLTLQARYQALRQYGPLLDQLKLDPTQEARLTVLLADKRQSAVDVVVTAFQRGEDLSQEPDRYREIVAGAKGEIEKQIYTLLGQERYLQYRDYDTSVAQGNVLRNVELSLRGSPETLTPEQTSRIKEILQGSDGARITAKMVDDAKEFLSPLQLQVLQDLRAVQQADEQKRIQRLQVALTPLPTDPKEN
jgi:hypothetical protein